MAALVVLAFIVQARAASIVQTQMPQEHTLAAGSIHWQEADLTQVLDFFADLTKRTVLRSPQVPTNVKITVRNQTPLTRQEAIDALNTLLGLNGISLIEESDKFLKAVPASTVGSEAPPFSGQTQNLRDSKKVVAQIIELKHIAPEAMASILQPFAGLANGVLAVKGSPVLILRDHSENVNRMLSLVERLDVALPNEIHTIVIPIKYALASDIANVLGGLTVSGSTVSFGAGQSTSGNTLPSSGASIGPRNAGGAHSGHSGGAAFTPRSASTTTSRSSATRNLASASASGHHDAMSHGAISVGTDIQPIGQAKIIADERSNALLVFAEHRELPMISNIVQKLDVVLPQVLIEALILEVNLSHGKSLGVSMAQNPQTSGKLTTAGASANGSFLDPQNIADLTSLSGLGTNGTKTLSGFNYFGRYGKDFDFAVNATANDSRITVLSRPRIQTSTAQAAQIFIGEQRPLVTGSYFSGYSGAGSRSQYALQDIGISLSVQPVINEDGLVTMTIAQQISQVGGTTKIDNNDVPITINRQANAYVSVHDRDTIILGGFISTTKSHSSSGVPFLKDIPGLGMLFRSSSENINRVELVVLIRPTVLRTPESAALIAARERDQMIGIKRAERDAEQFAPKQSTLDGSKQLH